MNTCEKCEEEFEEETLFLFSFTAHGKEHSLCEGCIEESMLSGFGRNNHEE